MAHLALPQLQHGAGTRTALGQRNPGTGLLLEPQAGPQSGRFAEMLGTSKIQCLPPETSGGCQSSQASVKGGPRGSQAAERAQPAATRRVKEKWAQRTSQTRPRLPRDLPLLSIHRRAGCGHSHRAPRPTLLCITGNSFTPSSSYKPAQMSSWLCLRST